MNKGQTVTSSYMLSSEANEHPLCSCALRGPHGSLLVGQPASCSSRTKIDQTREEKKKKTQKGKGINGFIFVFKPLNLQDEREKIVVPPAECFLPGLHVNRFFFIPTIIL